MPKVILTSSDNKTFPVDAKVAKCSDTIKRALIDCCVEDTENAVIPLPNVRGAILRKIIDWATHHKDDPEFPANEEVRVTEVPPWDREFLDVDQSTLFEIILAANYMDIRLLSALANLTVAKMIMNKTPEQIRETFNIVNDIAAEEEEAACHNNI